MYLRGGIVGVRLSTRSGLITRDLILEIYRSVSWTVVDWFDLVFLALVICDVQHEYH